MYVLGIIAALILASVIVHRLIRSFWSANGVMFITIFVLSILNIYGEMQGEWLAIFTVAMISALISFIISMLVGIPFYLKRHLKDE